MALATALKFGIPLISGLFSYLGNRKDKKLESKKVDLLTKQQQGIQNQLLGNFGGQYGQGLQGRPSFQAGEDFLTNLLRGGQGAFEQFDVPLQRQFQEETVPKIAERFSQFGAQNSSGFQNALLKAGSDLSTNLGALRGQMQLQALPQALGFAAAPGDQGLNALRFGMQPSFQEFIGKRQPGALSTIGNIGLNSSLQYLLSGLGGGSQPSLPQTNVGDQFGGQQYGQQNQLGQLLQMLLGQGT